jgi:integrase
MLEDALINDIDLLPYLVIGFFCGVRPDGELEKLQWSDVDLVGDADHKPQVTLRPEITKTNTRRFVDLSPNAIEWLQVYLSCAGRKDGRIVKYTASTLFERRLKNRKRAGVKRWPNSAMRHTFCSNWLAAHNDPGNLCMMTGHSNPNTLFRHYNRGTHRSDAEKFWNIRPPRIPANIVSIQSVA